MWLRQAVFRWLIPAAFVLPLWLFIGWLLSGAGGWAFLLLIIAMPAVLVSQVLLTVLVRVRSSVRTARAVSWWDAAGFLIWHALTVLVGFFPDGWTGAAVTLAIIAAIALAWSSIVQLWREARGGLITAGFTGTRVSAPTVAEPEVIVLREKFDGV